MSSELVNWISIIGSILSLVGVGIAIWQILLVKRAAVAAKIASDRTQRIISQNISLIDITACTKLIDDIQFYVRSERYEAALIRTSDLTRQLNQTQQSFPNRTSRRKLILNERSRS